MASSLRLRGNAFLKSVGFYAVLCCAVFLCFQEKKRKQHNRMISLWNREKSYAEAVKFYTQAIKARLAEGRKMLIFALAIASGNSASILRSYLVQIDLNQWTQFYLYQLGFHASFLTSNTIESHVRLCTRMHKCRQRKTTYVQAHINLMTGSCNTIRWQGSL